MGGSERKTLLVIFVSLVLDLLGFTIILPLFPSLLEYYKNNDEVSSSFVHFKIFYSVYVKLKYSSVKELSYRFKYYKCTNLSYNF